MAVAIIAGPAAATNHSGVVGNGVWNSFELAMWKDSGFTNSLADWPQAWTDDSDFTNNTYFNNAQSINDQTSSYGNGRTTHAVNIWQNAGFGGSHHCIPVYGASGYLNGSWSSFGISAYQDLAGSSC